MFFLRRGKNKRTLLSFAAAFVYVNPFRIEGPAATLACDQLTEVTLPVSLLHGLKVHAFTCKEKNREERGIRKFTTMAGPCISLNKDGDHGK